VDPEAALLESESGLVPEPEPLPVDPVPGLNPTPVVEPAPGFKPEPEPGLTPEPAPF
jgi:hypothetical protein